MKKSQTFVSKKTKSIPSNSKPNKKTRRKSKKRKSKKIDNQLKLLRSYPIDLPTIQTEQHDYETKDKSKKKNDLNKYIDLLISQKSKLVLKNKKKRKKKRKEKKKSKPLTREEDTIKLQLNFIMPPKNKPILKKSLQLKNNPNPQTEANTPVVKVLNPKLIKVAPVKKEAAKPEMSDAERQFLDCVIKVQSLWRMKMAVRLAKKMRLQNQELNEKLKKLEEEAFVQAIRIEREREERKRMKELKEKQMRQKREARKKKFLEAAYDGNFQELKFLISELEREMDSLGQDPDFKIKLNDAKRKEVLLGLIDCKDKNSNTALSEACAGGSNEVCKFLLQGGANPNSRGVFGRTPLWRAAFSGHLNCVQVMLENGADPRIYSEDGQRVTDATTNQSIKDLIENWNIQLTDRMLAQIERHKMDFKREQLASLDSRKTLAHEEYTRVKKQYETCKNELYKCNAELQRLHDEYLMNEKLYGELIEKKENEKVDLKIKYDDLREKMTKARINYKDMLEEVKKEKKTIKKSKSITTDETSIDDETSNKSRFNNLVF